MTPFMDVLGACDCHSHVYGPLARFPLSPLRTFDPPEAPIEDLEAVWQTLGLQQAVIVQGSAHATDHRALLAALEAAPTTRRGVAILASDTSDATFALFHLKGVRAARFNWTRHLLTIDGLSERQRLTDANYLLEKLSSLSWHAEVHIDITDLDLVLRLSIPAGMTIVIDHMARINASSPDADEQILRLLRLLERDTFWVKLSGADRLTVNCDDLKTALKPMRQLLHAAPERCVWGLDWPHVNLTRKRGDGELAELLVEVAGSERMLEQVLVHNPAKLYGFGLELAA